MKTSKQSSEYQQYEKKFLHTFYQNFQEVLQI